MEARSLTIEQVVDGLTVHLTNAASVPLVVQKHGEARPYLHPVRPLDGVGTLTEDAPDHHPWQHGIYTGLHGVGDSDFWFDHGQRVQAGRIQTESVGVVETTPTAVSWSVNAVWRSAVDARPLLHETQKWRLVLVADTWRLELDWQIRANEPLTMKAHKYGGPFVRMPYRSNSGCSVRNETGKTGSDCEQSRAAWIAVTMELPDRPGAAGFVISGDTSNQHERPLWRVDPECGVGPVVVAQELPLERDDTRKWSFALTCVTEQVGHEQAAYFHRLYTQEKEDA